MLATAPMQSMEVVPPQVRNHSHKLSACINIFNVSITVLQLYYAFVMCAVAKGETGDIAKQYSVQLRPGNILGFRLPPSMIYATTEEFYAGLAQFMGENGQ